VSEQHQMPPRLRYSRDRFMRRSAFLATVRFVGLLCVFGLQILLARLFADPMEYGKYAWGQSLLFMVGNMACLGLPIITARFIASLDAQHNMLGARRITNAAFRLLRRSAAAPPIVAILVWAFWHPSGDTAAYRDVAVIALLFAPAVTFVMLFGDVSRARQWLALAVLPMQVVRPIATAILAASCWWLMDGTLHGNTVVAIVGISVLIVLLLQASIYHRRQKSLLADEEPGPTPEEYQPSRLFPTALPIFVTRCASLVITYSNVILVGFLAGPTAAGIYFAAERLAHLANIPMTVVSMVNQQSMAAAHATGKIRDLQLLATQSAHGGLWPTLAASLGLVFFAGPLLQMFGTEFTPASTVLIILVASGVINVFTGATQDLLVMTGHQQRIPKVMILSAIAHVTALSLLVPSYGAVGAACASVISSLSSQTWLMYLTHRQTGIHTTVLGDLKRFRE
jgi:O-antigen/teichoic acid export membrane protein